MDDLLRTKLREHGLALRRLHAALRASPEILSLPYEAANTALLHTLRKKKEEFMQEIYNILTIALGVPPLPDRPFTYEYQDKDERAHSWTGTPREFYKEFSSAKFPPTEGVSLINDPRNEYEKLYTIEKLGNVWGGRDIAYVNTTVGRMKEAVVAVRPMFASTPFYLTDPTPPPAADSQSRPTTLLRVRRRKVLQYVPGNHGPRSFRLRTCAGGQVYLNQGGAPPDCRELDDACDGYHRRSP